MRQLTADSRQLTAKNINGQELEGMAHRLPQTPLPSAVSPPLLAGG